MFKKTIFFLFFLSSISVAWADSTDDFFKAVKKSDTAQVKQLLNKQPRLVLERDDKNMTGFLWAVSKKNLELVSFLAEKGARLTARGEKGNAFHIAAENQDEPMLKLLMKLISAKNAQAPADMLNYGRDIYSATSYTSSDGNTPLHIASKKCNTRIYNYFVNHGAQEDIPNHLLKTPAAILSDCQKNKELQAQQALLRAQREGEEALRPKDDGI